MIRSATEVKSTETTVITVYRNGLRSLICLMCIWLATKESKRTKTGNYESIMYMCGHRAENGFDRNTQVNWKST